jgi:hypothetical protein
MPKEENTVYGEVCAMAGKMRFRCVDKDGKGDMTFESLRYETQRRLDLKACGRKVRLGNQSLLRRDCEDLCLLIGEVKLTAHARVNRD